MRVIAILAAASLMTGSAFAQQQADPPWPSGPQKPYVNLEKARADSLRWAYRGNDHVDTALGVAGIGLAVTGAVIGANKRDLGKDGSSGTAMIVSGGAFVLAGIIVHFSEPKKPKPIMLSTSPNGVAVALRF